MHSKWMSGQPKWLVSHPHCSDWNNGEVALKSAKGARIFWLVKEGCCELGLCVKINKHFLYVLQKNRSKWVAFPKFSPKMPKKRVSFPLTRQHPSCLLLAPNWPLKKLHVEMWATSWSISLTAQWGSPVNHKGPFSFHCPALLTAGSLRNCWKAVFILGKRRFWQYIFPLYNPPSLPYILPLPPPF